MSMKKLAVVTFGLFCVLSARNIYAQDIFFSFGGEKIVKVAELPDTPEYQMDGEFADLGIIYKRFRIFFLTLVNYDKKWCLAAVDGGKYVALDRAQFEKTASEAGVSIPEKMRLPFTDAWLGKIILLVILVLVIWLKAQ